MAKKINVGDTVYLLNYDGYTEHTVEEKERDGNKFYYGFSGRARWYPRERIATTIEEAEAALEEMDGVSRLNWPLVDMERKYEYSER